MAYKKLPTVKRLKEVLMYDPKTGKFHWKIRPAYCIQIGYEAGGVDDQGYIRIRIDGIKYKAHQLAWLYMTGEWPETEIDHKNRKRHVNKWKNLRLSYETLNQRNRSLSKNNTSGHNGISWDARIQKWIAYIYFNKKLINLGSYKIKEDAVTARKEGESYYWTNTL